MFHNKAIEMATEAIPGAVLQIYGILLVPSLANDSGAVASILVSALSTGLTSAMIAYDMDTDPPHRKNSPGFYGFVRKEEAGARTFFLMTMISTIHNLVRR
tara:strand:+ start:132 stop:434 length:303 start_codon:yes stop_codon:yes gene_type:complete